MPPNNNTINIESDYRDNIGWKALIATSIFTIFFFSQLILATLFGTKKQTNNHHQQFYYPKVRFDYKTQ